MDTGIRVTCVMPTTASRRHFLYPSIQCFLNQTYTDSQLLILDEAPSPALGEWEDERVIYQWMPERGFTVGQKRNEVNHRAQTEVIAHWDSDDWYHPEYLERSIFFLDVSQKALIGYSGILYLKTPERTLWKYRYVSQEGPYVVSATMCYKRTWWEAHPFREDLRIGEDSEFWREAIANREVASRADEGLFVARAHGDNTFKPSFGDPPFVAADRSEFSEEFLREANL